MAAKLTSKERARIVELLREGKSQSAVAREVGRSKDTVGRIGREAGIESDGRLTKKATEAAAAIREIERMEIIHDVLATGQDLLAGVREARDYKDVVTGLAIGIDKHRLETGEATVREERVSADLKERLRAKLGPPDQLAARRGAREAS